MVIDHGISRNGLPNHGSSSNRRWPSYHSQPNNGSLEDHLSSCNCSQYCVTSHCISHYYHTNCTALYGPANYNRSSTGIRVTQYKSIEPTILTTY